MLSLASSAVFAAGLFCSPISYAADVPGSTTPTPPPASADDLSAALRSAAAAGMAEQEAEQSKAKPGPGAPQDQASTEALATALATETSKASNEDQNIEAQRAAQAQKHNETSFQAAQQSLFPLSSSQIRTFMHNYEETQQAAIPPANGQPEAVVKVQNISLDPGSPPPQINVAAGYITTVTILDMTGQPWPIIDIGVGGNFDIPAPEENSHIIRISPMSRFGYGNLSVRLKDLPTPVTFRLVAGGPTVYYRYDARMPKIGPLGKIPIIQRPNPLEAGDDVMLQILQNAPPSGAKRLKVAGTDARTMAWAIGERTFLRTPLSLLSPGWNASIASGDGTTVYEIGSAPVVLLSDNGMLVHAKVTEETAQ